jgi:hypothetical protein
MNKIVNKVEWIRDAKQLGTAEGILESPSQCCAMAATICRWNTREGKPQGVQFKQNIDYKTGVVKIILCQIPKQT